MLTLWIWSFFTLSRDGGQLHRELGVELYSKYIMIMHRTNNLPIVEGNGLVKHD
jgi:hypothetical protein